MIKIKKLTTQKIKFKKIKPKIKEIGDVEFVIGL